MELIFKCANTSLSGLRVRNDLETFYNQFHSRRQVIYQNHTRAIVYLNYLYCVN